jgi:hypothetical protein
LLFDVFVGDWFLQARQRLGVHPGYFSNVASETANGRPQSRHAKVGTLRDLAQLPARSSPPSFGFAILGAGCGHEGRVPWCEGTERREALGIVAMLTLDEMTLAAPSKDTVR